MSKRTRGDTKKADTGNGGQRGYPRPQLQRAAWTNLNGQWDFAIDKVARFTRPSDVKFNQRIVVPYAPETPLSGINDTDFYDAVWYRRAFDAPRFGRGQLRVRATSRHSPT